MRYLLNVGVRNPRMTTDHWVVLVCLWGGVEQYNKRYQKGRNIWPIAPPKGGAQREEDIRFQDLRREINTPKSMVKTREAWISERTWLVDRRTVLHRILPRDQRGNRISTRQFQTSLQADRCRRASRAGGVDRDTAGRGSDKVSMADAAEVVPPQRSVAIISQDRGPGQSHSGSGRTL